MKTLSTFAPAICLAVSTLLGGEAFAMGKKSPPALPAEGIRMAADVPADQSRLMNNDITQLETLAFQTQDPELLQIMGLNAVNASTLRKWLTDRVSYVVSGDFQLEKAYYIAMPFYPFENQNVKPDLEAPTRTPDPNSQVKVVMSNVGAAMYYIGKSMSTLLGLEIPGVGQVPVRSPRTGIIQVGEGLFRPLLRKQGSSEIDTPGNSMSRLGTFFHEARHSDGNGKHLAFFHVPCPEGHPLEGYAACDRNLNGPYTVGALVERAFVEACTTCSPAEREALRLSYVESFGRVMKNDPRTTMWDARPEGKR